MNHRHPAPNVGAATREPLLTPKEAAAWLRVSLSFLAKARMRGDGTPVLIEPSFADAIRMIVASDELPEQTRRHWATSLRQIAKALDKPLELIPAR